MWDLLKSFFRKKEPELPKEEVELNMLEAWLDEKTKPVIAGLNSRLAAAKELVARQIGEAKHNLEVLEHAELRNSEIPERAKHFMQGNREEYLKRVTHFLDNLDFPSDLNSFSGFYSSIQGEMQGLVQGIARPSQILKEFFADEANQVSSSIAAIEREINSVQQEIAAKAMPCLESTKQMAKELEFRMSLKKKFEDDFEAVQKEHAGLEKESETLAEEILLLKKDKNLKELEKKQLELKAKIEDVRRKVISPFSAIDSAMRKFEKITYKHKEIMQKYIESPLDALMQDMHLSIVKALSDMQSTIRNNRVDLKDRKKDKTLEVLQLLTKEYLGNFMTEYGQLKKEEGETAKAIEQSSITVLINEKKESIEKAKAKRIELERKSIELKKELEKISVDALKSDIEKNLAALTATAASLRL